uniref:Uncharacterized protein n=1 Tax=Anguilla anguilla TaxID=7936 RepID=A0A0E9S140_ANGAN
MGEAEDVPHPEDGAVDVAHVKVAVLYFIYCDARQQGPLGKVEEGEANAVLNKDGEVLHLHHGLNL